MQTYTFRVTLKGAGFLDTPPACIREIEAAEDKTLSKLAEWIIRAFDFDLDHAYGFYGTTGRRYFDADEKYELFADMDEADVIPGKTSAKSVERTALSDVFSKTGKKMLFVFDYGDEWLFEIEHIASGEKETGKRTPRITRREGLPPPQYPVFEED